MKLENSIGDISASSDDSNNKKLFSPENFVHQKNCFFSLTFSWLWRNFFSLKKIKLLWNSKTQHVMKLKNQNCDETQNSSCDETKNSNCNETQKSKLWGNSKTEMVRKLRNWMVIKFKIQIVMKLKIQIVIKLKKNQNVIKLKKSNCKETWKLKLWWNSTT